MKFALAIVLHPATILWMAFALGYGVARSIYGRDEAEVDALLRDDTDRCLSLPEDER